MGCSPKEWALNMAQETSQLDTLALIAIRNMLDVSISVTFVSNIYSKLVANVALSNQAGNKHKHALSENIYQLIFLGFRLRYPYNF